MHKFYKRTLVVMISGFKPIINKTVLLVSVVDTLSSSYLAHNSHV